MTRRFYAFSPVLAAALAACSVLPESPTLELGPAEATTVDDLKLAVADAPEVDEALSYSIQWYVDGTEVTELADAERVPSVHTHKGQTWSAVVTPSDAKQRIGESVTAEISVRNTPPTAELSIAEDVVLTTQDLVATVAGDDVDGDAVSFSWIWLRDGEKTSFDTDSVPAAETEKGEVWTVRVVPLDDEASGEASEGVISIENSLPVAESVRLDPETPTETSVLVATPSGHDPDADALTWTYVWSVDGEQVEVQGPEIDGTSFSKGQTVSVYATPSDAFAAGNAVTADVVVGNSAPTVESAALDPGEVRDEQTVRCAPTGWHDADGDLEAYHYDWTVNGTLVTHESTLSGERYNKGDAIACVLHPWDGEHEGPAVASEPVVVLNTIPVLASVSLDHTTPKTDHLLVATVNGASDVDEDKVSFTYDWSVNGTVIFSESTSATTSRLDGESWFSKGDTILVSATPNDGEDDGTAVTGTATVLNSAPRVAGVSFDLVEPRTGDVLTATAAGVSDADGDGVTLTWTWSVNGSAVHTETGSATSVSLDGEIWFSRGDAVQVSVTPDDGTDSGSSVASSAVVVGNSAPSVDAVRFDLSDPSTNDKLTATVSGAVDADGETITFDYAWSVDGTVVHTDKTTSTSSTLDGGTWFSKGQEVTVVVTPDDGTESGLPVTGPKVTVVNSPPQATLVAFINAAPKTNDDLVAKVTGAADADGDAISYHYSWSVNGTKVHTHTSTSAQASLSGTSWFDKGDVIVVTVLPTDLSDDGTLLTADRATVVNTAPLFSRVNVSPATLYTASTATADVGYSDPDGDPVTVTYAWTVDGGGAGSGSTLAGSAFAKGDVVAYTATADDGIDTASLASAGVTVSNTAPTAPTVAVSPADPDDTEDLLCGITAPGADADGDSLTYDIDWYKNGSAWAGSTYKTSNEGDTIDGADIAAGEKWHCVVTSWDGAAASTDATSGAVTVKASVGTAGVISGDPWVVCRAGSGDAWLAANSGGSYNAVTACTSLGYLAVDAWGGTCGTVCGYCGTSGKEYYDGGGGTSPSSLGYTVHWRCTNTL